MCNWGIESIQEFLDAYDESLVREASKNQKGRLIKVRRREFQSKRPALELALIERDGYVCSYPDCKDTMELAIDHIVPLSKGGTDDLSNLQFMCRPHNSGKGDR